jgi:dTDP-4-amino-4,6-dideoxygalactose transaminase
MIGDRHAGTFGDIAATSFYPGKNLGAWGDAGGVITTDSELAERVRLLRNYGSSQKYHHDLLGFNCRIDSLQAAVLSEKLPYLDLWNVERRRLAGVYDARFESVEGVEIIPGRCGSDDVCHLYVIRVDHRDGLVEHLAEDEIQALVHYPVPIPRHKAFSSHPQHQVPFPVADLAAERIISLPLFPGLRAEWIDRIVDAVAAYVAQQRHQCSS